MKQKYEGKDLQTLVETRVEIQLLRNGERAWIPYAELLLVVSRERFTLPNRST
jgi:hypothetical protein